MSTIIKLIFTALLLNACVQAGRSSWNFYQFQDSVQQASLFSGRETPEQLKARVLALAREQQVPIDGLVELDQPVHPPVGPIQVRRGLNAGIDHPRPQPDRTGGLTEALGQGQKAERGCPPPSSHDTSLIGPATQSWGKNAWG